MIIHILSILELISYIHTQRWGSYFQRWGSYFIKVTRFLLLLATYDKKYFVTVTYYLENKVTDIILHNYITFESNSAIL